MRFSKMHGIGNDYIYINCFEEKVENPEKVSVYVSDRHKGMVLTVLFSYFRPIRLISE